MAPLPKSSYWHFSSSGKREKEMEDKWVFLRLRSENCICHLYSPVRHNWVRQPHFVRQAKKNVAGSAVILLQYTCVRGELIEVELLGFTVKLMCYNLQNSSLTWAPFKALGERELVNHSFIYFISFSLILSKDRSAPRQVEPVYKRNTGRKCLEVNSQSLPQNNLLYQ